MENRKQIPALQLFVPNKYQVQINFNFLQEKAVVNCAALAGYNFFRKKLECTLDHCKFGSGTY